MDIATRMYFKFLYHYDRYKFCSEIVKYMQKVSK